MRLLGGVLILLVMLTSGFAADISAKWTGNVEIKTPEGEMVTQPFWAELQQKGQDVSGTAGGGDSDESMPIEKVVFDGKKLAFQVTGVMDGRIYKVMLNLIEEDRFEGSMDFALSDGTPLTGKITLKREKKG